VDNKDNQEGLTRRDFLRDAADGAAAVAGAAAGLGLKLPEALGAGAKSGLKYRTLGRTKLKVSELGLGSIRMENPAVVQRALDLGINYFDTAECYVGGRAEEMLGKGLRGKRNKVIVATKWHSDGRTPAANLLASLDASLKRLGMDHVDIIQIHGAGNAQQVNSDEVWEAFTTARKAGKVRFNGLSTHGNLVAVVQEAIKSKRYDCVLFSYNAFNGAQITPLMAEARKANVGTIAMKVLQPIHGAGEEQAFKNLRGSAYQKAIQWVLKDQNVSTAIVDMPTFDELEEDYKGAVQPVSKAELEQFELAVASIALGSCHLCGACTGQCPAGVKVADIMRYLLYHDGYGNRERAVALYRDLPASTTAAACAGCGECKPVCPWGVKIRARMERAHAVLA
jgi:hypothetical protein